MNNLEKVGRNIGSPAGHTLPEAYGFQPEALQISLTTTGRATWDSLYLDCQGARKSIEFEQYIIRDDAVGTRFLNLFAAKAREGVKIRLLLDRVGSRRVYNSPQVENIRRHNGEVVFYNPISWWDLARPSVWFPRNHVKAVLIDSKVAYIGSACLADYMAGWQELHARLTGEPVVEIEKNFAQIWGTLTSSRVPVWKQEKIQRKLRYKVTQPSQPNPIYAELLARIDGAKTSICLATPYFMPPTLLRQSLYNAVDRGVAVRIIASEESDTPMAVNISRSYFPDYLKRGIRIFSYQDTVFHAKYAIIDDEWAMLGSTNLDYLSLWRNRESNIILNDLPVIAAMRDAFVRCEGQSVELAPNFLKDVPIIARITGYLGRCIKRII